jgi:hypothetical protein
MLDLIRPTTLNIPQTEKKRRGKIQIAAYMLIGRPRALTL